MPALKGSLSMIGIMSAGPFEIAKPLFDSLQVEETHKGLRRDFYRGTLDGQGVVFTTSGIGKVRAAARAQFLLDHFDIDALIFTGVAGAINPDLRLGDIVVSRQVMEHDFDLTGIPEPDKRGAYKYDAAPELVDLAMKCGKELGFADKLHLGLVLTGDQIIAQQARKHWLWEMFKGDCVEMEGAAVAMVCWMNEVPFVLIRCISDQANENIIQDHPRWLPEAIGYSSSLVSRMISYYCKRE